MMLLAVCILAAGSCVTPHAPEARQRVRAYTVGIGEAQPQVVYKSLAVRVSLPGHPETAVGVLFDTDLLRIAAVWEGGELRLMGIPFDGRPKVHPMIHGGVLWTTPKNTAGWRPIDADSVDPRTIPYGVLDPKWGRYGGYVFDASGHAVVQYNIEGVKTHEHFDLVRDSDTGLALVRTIVRSSGSPARILVLGQSLPRPAAAEGRWRAEKATFRINQGEWEVIPGHVSEIMVPAVPYEDSSQKIEICYPISQASHLDLGQLIQPVLGESSDVDLCEQSNRQTVVIIAGRADGPFVVDEIPLPVSSRESERYPIRPSCLAVANNGQTLAAGTLTGDIWIAEGLPGPRVTWRRYAEGLFQPLGMTWADGLLYVRGRDQITRLHDTNGDGTADAYVNFNNMVAVTENYHEYCHHLERDAEGRFYFAKAGPYAGTGRDWDIIIPDHGVLYRLSRDGITLERLATGLRSPNGLGISSRGRILLTDNEGNWVPTSRVNDIQEAGYYGVEATAQRTPVPAHDPPLCWVPRKLENSPSDAIFLPENSWPGLSERWLIGGYGTSSLFLLLEDTVSGSDLAGLTRLPIELKAAPIRGVFEPGEQGLYLAALGIDGTMTNAQVNGALYRIRSGDKAWAGLTSIERTRDGIRLSFARPLPQSIVFASVPWRASVWNYRRTAAYGSGEYRVTQPEQEGHDPVWIERAVLSEDRSSVQLIMPTLGPVQQLGIYGSWWQPDKQSMWPVSAYLTVGPSVWDLKH